MAARHSRYEGETRRLAPGDKISPIVTAEDMPFATPRIQWPELNHRVFGHMIRERSEILGTLMRRVDARTWWLAGLAALFAIAAIVTAPVTAAQNPSLLFSTPITGGGPVLMTADAQGYIYLAGKTSGPSASSFVMKLTPSRSVVYTSYFPIVPYDFESYSCPVAITGIAADKNGAAYITGCTSGAFPLVNPFRPTLQGVANAFVTKLSPSGTLVYSTYFGAGGAEYGTGIAVDDQGNAYVVGAATGQKLPLVNPVQTSGDAFAAKFDPSGSRLLYSTYLAGSPKAIAVDRAGAAYIVGDVTGAFPAVRPVQPCHDESELFVSDAFVIKLSVAGSSYDYATCLGGFRSDVATGVAVDASGSAYVVGMTQSIDFPTARPLDQTLRTGAAWKTNDAGRTWENLPLDANYLFELKASTASMGTWYAGAMNGAFKGIDQGAQWHRLGLPLRDGKYQPTVYHLVPDPRAPSTVYALTSEGLYKSSDGGERWTGIGSSLPFGGAYLRDLVIDPADSRAVYAGSQNGFFKSLDGGSSWAPSNHGLGTRPYVNALSVDALTGALYVDIEVPTNDAVRSNRVFRSTDAGQTWTPTSLEIRNAQTSALIAVASRRRPASRLPRAPERDAPEIEPGPIYVAATSPTSMSGALLRSDDGGETWASVGRGLPASGPDALAVAPSDPRIVYAASRGVLFVSRDRGDTFEPLPGASILTGSARSLAVDPTRAETLWMDGQSSDAFVAKIRPGGGSLEYSTYLGGSSSEFDSSVVVDELGRAIVFGSTSSRDFPAVTPVQQNRGGGAFVSVLDGGGSVLLFSTSIGTGNNVRVVSAVRFGRGMLISGGSNDLAGMFPGSTASGAGAFVGMLDLSLSGAPFRVARRP